MITWTDNSYFGKNVPLMKDRIDSFVHHEWAAFCGNFSPVVLHREKNGYIYIYNSAEDQEADQKGIDGCYGRWIAYFGTIEELRGWLWGMVQGINKRVKPLERA